MVAGWKMAQSAAQIFVTGIYHRCAPHQKGCGIYAFIWTTRLKKDKKALKNI
jgi:hypothetical protein